MKNERAFRLARVRPTRDLWSWVAGAVIVALLLVNVIGLANRMTGGNLASIAGLELPASGFNDNVAPTRTR